MSGWNGWAGKILRVDLSTKQIEMEPLSEEFALKYIGGRGFGGRILYDEVGPEIDAFDPENIIIIGQGPLCGTLAPSSGRFEMVAKSPLTGIFGSSNGGGFFGPEMKWAGYDLIIIRGKSEKPVYLWINDDVVELKDAGHLWGKDTWVTQQIIRDELRDDNIKTLKIGLAGENLCFSSCVIADLSRAAGKCGFGALWGSKKLKAVAVRGTKGVNIAKPGELVKFSKELSERIKDDPMYQTHTKYGTTGWVGGDYVRASGVFRKNLSGIEENGFDEAYDKNFSCFSCPLHCGHYYSVKSGKYKGTVGEGVDGNAQLYLGIATRVGDPNFICHYNTLCDKLGINLDLPGSAIAWAMQLYEDGIINKEDTDGIELTWGNQDAILDCLQKMAHKEGFGEILDAYPIRAAQMLGKGSELYISHGKGNYDRGAGFAGTAEYTLAFAVATRGRDHLVGCTSINTPNFRKAMTNELLEKLGLERYNDPEIFTEAFSTNPKKALRLFDNENLFCIADMTGSCKFIAQLVLYVSGIGMEDFSRLLTATTGVDCTVQDLNKAAEREFSTLR